MMKWYWIASIVAGAFLLASLIFMVPFTYSIAKKIYFGSFVRKNPQEWGRVCSCPSNEEQLRMFNAGVSWAAQHRDVIKELSISNDGLKLVGEYFDFKKEMTIIILPGRCESLLYSYYYAMTYTNKCNVLVIDQRAHGESEGQFSTAGIKEGEDALLWAKLLKEKCEQKEVVIHGVCIGGASAIRASSLDEKNQYIDKLILDGIFVSFYDTIKRHTIAEGHNPFPVVNEIPSLFRKYARVDIMKYTPLKMIRKVDVPILFIHSRVDVFSLPKNLALIVEASPSVNKTVVWFEKGGHSHIRINNEEKYDETILSFLRK